MLIRSDLCQWEVRLFESVTSDEFGGIPLSPASVITQADGRIVEFLFAGLTDDDYQITWQFPSIADGVWQHFALVLDSANNEATLFSDGSSRGPLSAFLAPLQVNQGGLFLGLEHRDGVMSGMLNTGTRRLPSPQDVDQVFGDRRSLLDLLFIP